MTGKLKGLVEKKEKLKIELKLIEAKYELYIYLSRLEFYYRYIDEWIDDAEKSVVKTFQSIKKGELTRIQERKVKQLLSKIQKAAIEYHKL